VSHQAALADVRESQTQPDVYADVNVIGTIRLLEAARQHGTRKFIMASTGGAIYGEQPDNQIPTSEQANAQPIDPYGVSKLSAEHYLRSYQTIHGLDFCALRYGNVYGPRQNNEGEAGVIAIFTTRMLQGEPVTIFGDGLQVRDFVFVEDVARANVAAAQQGSGIYNIGTGVASNINTVFHTLARLTDFVHPEQHGPAKPGEVRISCIEPTKAARELHWEAQTSLVDGLAKTVAYFRNGR
jgi:UDP-glucose 4-epimerase